MAEHLRIGGLLDGDETVADTVTELEGMRDAGFVHAFATQMFNHDTLTLLAAAATRVPGIDVGTAVIPVYARHPTMLAQQALTTQSASGNRLILGIGLSHQVVIEGMWGISFDKPARYMREYLAVLMPLLHGETVNFSGERITANVFAPISIPGVTPPPVLIAALGSVMLKLAGTVADGTVTWMTGQRTLETHIVPTISAAAQAAGRPAPRVAASLPVCVTADLDAVNETMDTVFAMYPHLPSYKAMLDLEGVERPSEIGIAGDEETVAAGLERLTSIGVTDFVANIVGNKEERGRTFRFLSETARSLSAKSS